MHEGTIISSKAAITAFVLIFLIAMIRECSVAGSCLRGTVVMVAVFFSVKVLYHLFFKALVDGLTEHISNENILKKQRNN